MVVDVGAVDLDAEVEVEGAAAEVQRRGRGRTRTRPAEGITIERGHDKKVAWASGL